MAATRPRGATRYVTLASATVTVAVVSIAVNVALRYAAVYGLSIPQPQFEPLNLGAVTMASAVGAVGAGAVFGALAAWTPRPVRLFAVVSAIVLVASCYPTLDLLAGTPRRYPGTTVEAVAVLLLMHVVVAAAALGILTRAWTRAVMPARSRS